MSPATILYLVRAIETTLGLMGAAPEVIARWQSVRSKVRQMVKEGRDPTPAEFEELERSIAENAVERDQILAKKTSLEE